MTRGINDLRRMENGEKSVKTSKGYEWREYKWSDAAVEKFKKERLELQARGEKWKPAAERTRRK